MYSSSLSFVFEEKYGMVKFVFWSHIITSHYLRLVFVEGVIIQFFLVLWLFRFFAGGA